MSSNSFLKNIARGVSVRVRSLLTNPYREVNLNWLRLKYYKHLSTGKLRKHILFGKPLYYYSAQELLHGLREIFIDKIYKLQLNDNPYILDCGANIGMSVIFLKQQYPDAEIIAFEPDEANFELLVRNLSSFEYSSVTLLKKAVWNANTILNFSNESSMGSKVERASTVNTRKIDAVRLKDYLNKDIDFLKIDIEGAENVVLYDIAEDLHFVKNMFLEYHGTFEQNGELAKIMNIINEAGFNFYIKEAASIYDTPFVRRRNPNTPYDVQLNIFCFKK